MPIRLLKMLLLPLLLVCHTLPTHAQSFKLMWEKTKTGSKGVPAKMIATSDGKLLMVGQTLPDTKGNTDAWVAKFDTSGKLLWQDTLGGEKVDAAVAVVETYDKGFAVVGNTQSRGKGMSDMWLIRLDTKGKVLWDSTYGFKKNDFATAIIETADHGFAVAGATESKGHGEEDFWLVRFDAFGRVLWDGVEGYGKTDIPYSLVETPDHFFMLAGYTISSYGFGGKDAYVVKFDTIGQRRWDRIKGGAKDDVAHAIMKTGDGNYTVYATTHSRKEYPCGWFMKISPDGKKWLDEKTIFPTGTLCQHVPLECKTIIETRKQEFIAAGKGFAYEKGDNLILVHCDQEGKQLDFTSAGGSQDEEGISVAEGLDGSLYVAAIRGANNFVLYKIKPE